MEVKFRPISMIDYDSFDKLKPDKQREFFEKRPDLILANNLAAICEQIQIWVKKVDEINKAQRNRNQQQVQLSPNFIRDIMKKST